MRSSTHHRAGLTLTQCTGNTRAQPRVVPAMRTTAIPTRYAGVRFRSRLEARWAALATRLGWSWLYEPLDLPGYIPDFLLWPDEPTLRVVMEVKPALSTAELAPYAAKLEAWEGEALLVGARLHIHKEAAPRPPIGPNILARRPPAEKPSAMIQVGRMRSFAGVWRDAYLGHTSVRAVSDRGMGQPGSPWYIDTEPTLLTPALALDVELAWADVGNETQWARPPDPTLTRAALLERARRLSLASMMEAGTLDPIDALFEP